MLGVALAEVLRSPYRTALRALAIGGAVSVTLLFEGFRLGMDRQMATPAGSLPAALVAVEEGAKHFVAVRSDLPQSARAAVEAVPGVKAVHPLVSVPVIFKHAARRTPIQLVAYDSGGAPRIGAGRGIAGPRQVVLDQQLARLHGLGLGQRIELLDRELTIVGFSTGTDVSFAPLVFVTYDELIDLYLERNVPGAMGGAPLLSFLLIDLDPTASIADVRRAIEANVAGVDVYTPAELAAQDVALGRQLFGPVLNLFIAIGWLAVVLAVGLTMYAAVIDRRRDFGVMKAVGMGSGGLALTVMLEALLVSLAAFPLALLLSRGAAAAIEGMSPLYRVVAWEPSVVTRGALAALFAAFVGSLVPVRRLAALEPDVVFRS
jgi:putative ABC transport system permease protein